MNFSKTAFFLTSFFCAIVNGLQLKQTSTEVTTSSDRGPIGFAIGGGYQQTRLLNQDGTYSSGKGSLLGLSIDLKIFEFQNASLVKIFGSMTSGNSKGEFDNTEQIIRKDTIYGFKIYPNSWIYVAGAMGQESLSINTSNGKQDLSANIISLGLGFEFKIANSFSMGLSFWQKNGAIPKDDSTTLKGNSNFDSIDGLLLLIWSPPSSFLY